MRAFAFLAVVCLAAGPAAAQDGPAKAAAAPTAERGQVNTVADAVRAIPPAAEARSEGAAGPMPASNPGTWVRTEDYPDWAVRYDVSGRVSFKVQVSEAGRATRCEVTQSSGIADLDDLACQKVIERARFVPARDVDGEPVAGTWASSVVWAIPDEGPEPAPEPGYVVIWMIVEPDGTVSDCEVERAEGAAAELLSDECPAGRRFEPILGPDGNPQRTRVRMMARLVHEPL